MTNGVTACDLHCALTYTVNMMTCALHTSNMCAQVALLAEVVAAWNRSAGAKTGIFDTSFNGEAFRNSTGAGGDYGALAEGVACHHLWIGYLTEAWQVRACPTMVAVSCRLARLL